jgi:hypothetical protein
VQEVEPPVDQCLAFRARPALNLLLESEGRVDPLGLVSEDKLDQEASRGVPRAEAR